MRNAWLELAVFLTLTSAACASEPACTAPNASRVDGVCKCVHGSITVRGELECVAADQARDGAATDPIGTSPDGEVASTRRDAGVDARVDAPPEVFDAQTNPHAQGGDASLMVSGDDAATQTMPGCTGSACAGSVVKQLAVGWDHNCVLTSAGKVFCWGDNGNDEGDQPSFRVGPGATGTSQPKPVEVPGLGEVAEIGAGRGHTCARSTNGDVRCWGDNLDHELGPTVSGANSAAPVQIAVSNAVQITVGGRHACAVLATGSVACWGESSRGELGGGSTTAGADGSVVMVPGLTDIAQVSAGATHTCALTRSGKVSCWGSNEAGQVGSASLAVAAGSVAVSPLPVDIQEVISIRAGHFSTCAVWQSQTAACWGDLDPEQEPRKIASSATPSPQPLLTDIAQLSLGARHACAALTDGRVACWGLNTSGQLGFDPSVRQTSDPDWVPNLDDVTYVGAASRHSCALARDGSVRCWGYNESGQLGDATSASISALPVVVQGW